MFQCLRHSTLALLAFFALSVTASAGRIYLKSQTVDTSLTPPSAAESAPLFGTDVYLLQLGGPVNEEQKQALLDAGAQLIEYVPEFAFIVRVQRARLRAIRRLPFVEWIGPFKVSYKFSELPSSTTPRQYLVSLFPGSSVDHVLTKSRKTGMKTMGCRVGPRGSVYKLVGTASQIAQLARSASVAWVEPYVQPRLCNNVAGQICRVPDVRQNLGLYGAGQLVGVADAGLDTGNLSTLSPDFLGRVERVYALRRSGEWNDLNGHGTHVIGTLLGSGVLSGSNPAIHAYDGSFAGVAPEAKLVFQSIGDAGSFVFPPLHLAELFQPVYDDGVRVHNNSWGSAMDGAYTVYSYEVDQFAWDHKDFLPIFAVGNEAEDANQDGVVDRDSLYAPATAKNCIAVGATESVRATGGYQMGYGVAWTSIFPFAPLKYDLMSNNAVGIAAFSGRGPTDDGRVKPDLCAPGTNIISCRSHAASFAGWAAYSQDYIYWGGTSMSAPQVAGAAVLVREYCQKEKGITPSAALVKAILINGAADISPGQYGTSSQREVYPAPDPSQGWGRLDVKQSLCPTPPAVNEFVDESLGLSTGDTREYIYTVTDTSVPLRVTLVWTDYPGAVQAARELVNDLDLTVVSPTGIVHSQSPPDRLNNVERITIRNPENGEYRVRVTAYNIPMGPQDYALVVSGGLPAAYISGKATSTSGAGVQGALITLVSASGVKRVTTDQSGNYSSRVAPGTYSVQVGKPGWKFSPRARTVAVGAMPVIGVDFTGTGAPGSVAGTITSSVGGVVSEMVESPHPYPNSFDKTYVIKAHEQATRMRVHFAEIDLMNDGDTVYVLNAKDEVVNTFTGRGEDVWSDWVDGNSIRVRLCSNEFGNAGYGFVIDGYETDFIGQGGLEGALITLSPGGYHCFSTTGGGYTLSSVPPGTYTLTPTKPHWKFQPTAKSVDIPAGNTQAHIDFIAFPPGAISGEIRASSSKSQLLQIQSPHPYPDNYSNTWEVIGPTSATRIRLHFKRIATEPAWDFVYILDSQDNVVETYTADYTDIWTPWVDGYSVKIQMITDGVNNEWGFECDRYEVETLGGGVGGVLVSVAPLDLTTQTSSQGLFRFPNVDCGNHTVTPSLSPWIFNPVSASVSISPGMEKSLIFYARIGDLNSASHTKALCDGTSVTLRGVVVSAVFADCIYVQGVDGPFGIRVEPTQNVAVGDIVDVAGIISTSSGERIIRSSELLVK